MESKTNEDNTKKEEVNSVFLAKYFKTTTFYVFSLEGGGVCFKSRGKLLTSRTSSNDWVNLRGPSTLTWELRKGDCKTTLEDKQKIINLTYYISSESLRDAEREKNN